MLTRLNGLACEELRPTLYVMNRESEEPLLCVAMRRQYLGKHDKDFVVVQIISPQYLEQLMTEPGSEQGALLIFDKNMQFLICRGEAISMRLVCIIGSITCAFFSIIVAYRGTKRSYRPIGNMVQKIGTQAYTTYDSALNSEFEFIENILERTGTEKNNLSKKLRKSENLRLERFIVSLLENGTTGTISGEDDFQKTGMELCSSKFMAVVIFADRNTEMEGEVQSFIVKNVFAELCNKRHKGYVAQLNAKNYVVLVNLRGPVNLVQERESWQEGQAFWEKYYHLVVTVAVGEIQKGFLKSISLSGKQSKH